MKRYGQPHAIRSLGKGKALYLTGVGVGALTCLTGEGDWWRAAATFETAEAGGGDIEVGFPGTRGGVL